MASLPQSTYTEHFLYKNQLIRAQLQQCTLILFDQFTKWEIPLQFATSFITQSDIHGNLSSITLYSKQIFKLAHNNPTVLEQWATILNQIIHKVGFHQDYALVKNLAEGASGKVYLAKSLRDGTKIVAKAYCKKKMDGKELLAVQNQISILRSINCSYFPKFIGTYQTEKSYYLLMEFVPGITLKNVALDKRVSWTEKKRLLAQIGFALKYLHQMQTVHRDIKPQNIIYNSKTGEIKIVDFGFAFNLRKQAPIYSNCGTAGFAPPESFNKSYKPSFKGDMFALGVLAHFLFTGELPYRSSGRSMLIDTRDCKFSFSACKNSSLLNLLKRMICHESERINIDSFLCSSFILEQQESPKNNPQAKLDSKNTQNLSTLNKRVQSFYGRQRGLSVKLKEKSKIGQNYLYRNHLRLITNLF